MSTANSERSTGSARSKWMLGTGLALAVASTFTVAYYQHEVDALTTGINAGKLHGELLLSEKLQLEKDIAALHTRLSDLAEQNGAVEARAVAAERRTTDAVKRAEEYLGKARRTDALRKEVADLRAQKQDLEQRAREADGRTDGLRSENDRLAAANTALQEQLALNARGSAMVNNGLLEAVKGGKGKLTVVARRTRDIRMAFDLPEALAKEVSFKVITPDGRSYEGKDPRISLHMEGTEPEPTASLVPMTDGLERAARVHLDFKPTEKLKPGTYRIDIRSGEQYLGTAQVRLR